MLKGEITAVPDGIRVERRAGAADPAGPVLQQRRGAISLNPVCRYVGTYMLCFRYIDITSTTSTRKNTKCKYVYVLREKYWDGAP